MHTRQLIVFTIFFSSYMISKLGFTYENAVKGKLSYFILYVFSIWAFLLQILLIETLPIPEIRF